MTDWLPSLVPSFMTPVIARFKDGWEFGRKHGRWVFMAGQPGIGKSRAINYYQGLNPPDIDHGRVPVISSVEGGGLPGHVYFIKELNAFYDYQPEPLAASPARLIENIVEFKTEQILIDDIHALSVARLKLVKTVTDAVEQRARRKISVGLVGVTLDGFNISSPLDLLNAEDFEQFQKRIHPRYRGKVVLGPNADELPGILGGFENAALGAGVTFRVARKSPRIHQLLSGDGFQSLHGTVTMQNVVDLLEEVMLSSDAPAWFDITDETLTAAAGVIATKLPAATARTVVRRFSRFGAAPAPSPVLLRR
ncbi:MAG TPA: hypothetical protein VF494_05420 [Candidatus Limnocylindrales bacterium]